MTDYKQLCAELIRTYPMAWGPSGKWRNPEQNLALERARAALAEPTPEGPTDEELDELFTEIDQSGEPESWRVYARAVLARWGNHPGSLDSSTQPS